MVMAARVYFSFRAMSAIACSIGIRFSLHRILAAFQGFSMRHYARAYRHGHATRALTGAVTRYAICQDICSQCAPLRDGDAVAMRPLRDAYFRRRSITS